MTNGDGAAPGGFSDDVELASASFGQGETFVTPLQMALVASTVANDGVLMRPQLVTRAHGRGRRHPDDRRRRPGAGSSAAADAQAIQAAMQQAVEGDLGRQFTAGAKVPGVPTAGKSGTAELGGSRRAALVVHRLRAGREPAGRDRRARRARRPGRGARGAARRDAACQRYFELYGEPVHGATRPSRPPEPPVRDARAAPARAARAGAVIALGLARRCSRCRRRVASFVGGEPFLGVDGRDRLPDGPVGRRPDPVPRLNESAAASDLSDSGEGAGRIGNLFASTDAIEGRSPREPGSTAAVHC